VSGSERAGRRAIYLQAVGTAAAYVLAIVLVDTLYVGRHVHDAGMAFGYAFCLVQAGAIGVLLALSVAIKFVRHRWERHWERLRPMLLEKATACLAGNGSVQALSALQRRHPREVDRCMAELLHRVHGAAHTRLSALAAELGLVERWKEQYRSRRKGTRKDAISRLGSLESEAAIPTLLRALDDADDEIKLDASRALVRSSGEQEIAAVFQAALRGSLLIRAILTEALRPHALALCESALPAALASPDTKTVRMALEVVGAWGKSLPLPPMGPLLEHADAGVRAAALTVLPKLAQSASCEREVVERLADANEQVRAAAAEAAGKLRLASAVAGLRGCLQERAPQASVAAAYALARIGPEGCRLLEEEVLRSRTASAAAALEALERLRSDRMLLAGL